MSSTDPKPEQAAEAHQGGPSSTQEASGDAPQQPAPEGTQVDPGAAEGAGAVPDWLLGVSTSVDPDAGFASGSGLGLPPGALDAAVDAGPPSIPPELDGMLNARERRTVWHMVAGKSYHEALDACNVPKRAQLRDTRPPDYLLAAVHAVNRQIAFRAGLSRRWIVENTVALYRRAAQAEEVLDRKGKPTGVYKFDGATASKCLDMLAQWEGSLYPKRHADGLRSSEVAELLRLVAGRGRPEVPHLGDRPAIALPASGFAASQQGGKSE